MSHDTSANLPETLAKPPKPLANWSSPKRLQGETTETPAVASWAFERFLNKDLQIATSQLMHLWPRVWSYVGR